MIICARVCGSSWAFHMYIIHEVEQSQPVLKNVRTKNISALSF
jgi:hypothetical protein